MIAAIYHNSISELFFMGDFSIDLKSLVSIIALLATITIGYLTWRRTHKSLSYEILADSPLLTTRRK